MKFKFDGPDRKLGLSPLRAVHGCCPATTAGLRVCHRGHVWPTKPKMLPGRPSTESRPALKLGHRWGRWCPSSGGSEFS